MFELTVQEEFAAAHAIVMGGVREAVHGHNWRVSAVVAGEALDADGLLVDFHAVQRTLGEICGRFHNGNLNEIAPFDATNPTAELVAKHIADELDATLGGGVRVASVTVTEAPGCAATWRSQRAK